MPKRRAFTLIELLIVIAIIALLISLAFVGFSAIHRSQLRRNTRAAMEVARGMFNEYVSQARAGGNNVTSLTGAGGTQFYLRLAPNIWYFNSTTWPPPAPTAYPPDSAVPPLEKIDLAALRGSGVPAKVDFANSIDYYNVPNRYDTTTSTPDLSTGGMVPMDVPITDAATLGDNTQWANYWQLYQTMLTIQRIRSAPETKALWATLSEAQIVHVGATNSRQDYIVDAWGHPILFVPGSGMRGVKFGEWSTTSGYVSGDPSSQPLSAIRSPDGRAYWVSAGPDGNFQTQDDNLYSFDN